MDKLKNLLKSDTPTTEEQDTTRTGTSRLSGQGSHFPGKEQTSAATGSTVTGTDPQTRGPTDVSTAPASSTAAAFTSGPEQGGSGHVNTTSSSAAVPPTQTTGGATEYTVSSADFPKTDSLQDGSGTAAIGSTSTYSSSHLTRGDPTSSVVDPSSADPLTYKKPEATSDARNAGVGAGAAHTAASLAFNQGEERKKEMSGSENPYRTTHIDPRVDGMSKASAERATASSERDVVPERSTVGSNTGFATAGATSAVSGRQARDDVVVPSTLATTADPADRSAEYGASTNLKGVSDTAPSTAATTTATTETEDNRQSIVGRALGAFGLGGLASSLGASGGERDASAVADTPEQPTTTTGLESYTAPTQQGPPTTHHRKESIPTTAYPSATFDSPRAINPPIGGAGSPVIHGDQESHTGRNVATGIATGGAAVGAAAVGNQDYDRSKALRENISGEPQGSAPAYREAGETTALTGVDSAQYRETQNLRQNIAEQPSGGNTTFYHAATIGDDTTTAAPATGTTGLHDSAVGGTTTHTTSSVLPDRSTQPTTAVPMTEHSAERDHTTRDTALGAGAGAAAVGAGAYGAHEYSKKEAEHAETEAAREQAAREKELARQKQEQEKELEKQHKADEKAAAKEEKHHQKELEKEEKKHQKEMEKEEKQHEKEAEAAALKQRREQEKEQARLAKIREEEEEERRRREQRESLVGAAGVGGAGAAAGEEREKEKEKKPSLFRRIFKRRKNKDTGEEEDYSSDDDQHLDDTKHNRDAVAAYGATVAGATGATYATQHEKIDHGSRDVPAGASSYEQQTGGLQKPSYNPFNKNESPIVTSAPGQTGPTTATATGGPSGEAVTGLPYGSSSTAAGGAAMADTHERTTVPTTLDSTDVRTSQPISGTHDRSVAPATLESTGVRSQQPLEAVTGTTTTTGIHDKSTAPATLESTGTRSQQPTEAVTGMPAAAGSTGTYSQETEPITGLPYDASKDPAAAKRLSEHHHGYQADRDVSAPSGEGTSGGLPVNTNFTLGEVEGSHGKEGQAHQSHEPEGEVQEGGIGEKIKDSFKLGGL